MAVDLYRESKREEGEEKRERKRDLNITILRLPLPFVPQAYSNSRHLTAQEEIVNFGLGQQKTGLKF